LKTCRICKELKAFESFSACSARKDGFATACKPCVAATRPSRAGCKTGKLYWERFYAERRNLLLEKQRESAERRLKARNRYVAKKDEIRKVQRAYQATSEAKALHAVIQRKRNARIRAATPTWLTPEQRQQLAHTYWLAKDATRVTGEPYHVDHLVPLRGRNVCGLHVPWNIRVVPADVNLRKHTALEEHI